VTKKEHVAILPAVSVVVQVSVVEPKGKVDPDTGSQVVVEPGQLSTEAGTVKSTEVGPSTVWSMLLGHVMEGGSISLTVMVKSQVMVASVVTLTVVVPTEKKLPLGGLGVITPQFIPVGAG
jgi:hypothetical protein